MLFDTAILVMSPLLKIYATAEFIDASIRLLSEEAPLTDALFPIAVVVLVSGYSYLGKSIRSIVAIRLTAKLRVIYGSMRMDKMAVVAYHNIEDPNVLELLKRTEDDGEIICKIYQSMLNAVVLLAQILSVFAAIMMASLLTGLIVLVVSLPLMKIAAKSGKREYDLEREEAACKRRYEYFYDLLSGRDSVEERTLFQYGSFVEKHMLKFYEMFRKKSIVVTIRNNINVEGGSIVTSLFTVFIASMLLFSYYRGNMTIGLFLSLFSEVMSLTETMSWGFAGAISELTNNHQKLKDIDAFFRLPEEEMEDLPVNRMPGIPSITFRDVWFKYPNTDRYILQGLSFSISAGFHYAFVGKNGAGKSTVIKLLVGLYRDYEGEILIDGKELREYPVEELRKLYAVIYQDFAKYQVSLYDNISFGNPECTQEQIGEVIKRCGLEELVEKIGGVRRPLGRIAEGGVELSGGEWQRIALARALIKENALLILDEPTSALDPLMENQLYEEFGRICQNRTSIFISHRLGSTKLAVIILQHATNGIGHSVIPALKLKLDREALVKLERKVRDVPAEWFEHREFLDFLEKAYKGTGYCFALLVPMLRFLFKYGPYCVLMGLYLKRYDPVLALCVVLIFIPAFASMVIRPDLIFELEDHAAPARRMDAYLKKCVGGPEYFKETRTLGISGHFKSKFLENVKLLNGYIWKAQKKIKLVELMTTLFSVFGYGGVMVLLVVSLLRGRITTALYASVFSSITLMYAMCDDAAYHFLSPFDGVAIVNSFVALIKGKLPERKDRPVDFSKPIVAEDITFSYPGADKPALDHVSFRVRAGETIAIVGNNGSGKTTLSKILLGIYTPKSGSVKFGDVDIGEISSKSVGVGMSAVFQNFLKYKMSVEDNIRISDPGRQDRAALENCAAQFDMDFEAGQFAEGRDTILSREFGGTELSGGQWQKIAIMRGMYRDREVMVLDEPTSAIDPLEETRLYQKFAEMAEGRTAFIVTHRIGLTKIADRIMVMDRGRLVQTGTYEELEKEEGMFREMLQAQKKWYMQEKPGAPFILKTEFTH